jgi:hypothetical protein
VRGQDARHPGADDDHLERSIRGEVLPAPSRRPAVLAPIGQLLFQQRQVGVHAGHADGVLQDGQQPGIVGRGCRAASGVPVADEHLEGQLTDLALLVVGESPLGHAGQERIGTEVVLQQRQVARQVGEGGEQRRELGLVERRTNLLVGLGDGNRVAHEGAR